MDNITYELIKEKLSNYIELEATQTQMPIENCFKTFDFMKFTSKLQFTKEQLSQASNVNSIHTSNELQNLNGKFVKYHCMIQNISEPEICIGFAKKSTISTNNILNDWQILVYNEDLHLNEQEYESLEKNGIMIERYPVCCVPVPQLNEWVKEIDNSSDGNSMVIEEDVGNQKQEYSCLVKLYGDPNQTLNLRLNEEVVFYGILYYSSTKIQQEHSDETDCLSYDQTYPIFDYPRIHCLYFEKTSTDQLLLSKNYFTEQITPEFASSNYQIINSFLNQIFNNDSLAVHYIFLALISGIYQKNDQELLGKIILNLSNTKNQIYTVIYENNNVYTGTQPQILAYVLSKIMLKSQLLNLTIKSLCESNFQALKNFDTQKLEQGHLQLTPKTCLLINETSLEAGTLNQKGIESVAALNNLLDFQKITLNFTYQNVYLETDVQAIIFSEGKSFLQHDIQVKLENTLTNNITINKVFYETIFASNPNLQTLYSLRQYIVLVSNEVKKVTIEQKASKFIEEEFLQERKKQEQKKDKQTSNIITPRTLHQWIVQSKALSAAKGYSKVDESVFKEVKTFDKQRIEKIF